MIRALGCIVAFGACGRFGFATRPDVSPDAIAVDPGVDALAAPPPGMVTVPLGLMPFDFQPGTPWKQASLTRGFYADIDEVTVGRWRAWMAAGQPAPCDSATADPDDTCALDPHYPTMRWRTAWNPAVTGADFTAGCASPWAQNGSTFPIGDDSLPMNCMTWTQAIAFCAWDGHKRLPTELEWNYEARGGNHRLYVWGDQAPDCTLATFGAAAPAYCGFPIAAGSAVAGRSLHGVRDLNGSLWEWGWDATLAATLDPTADEVPPDSVDFTGLALGSGDNDGHVIFGGEWGEDINNLDLVNGNHHAPGISWQGQTQITTTGVRCVKTM